MQGRICNKNLNKCVDVYDTVHQRYANFVENGPSWECHVRKTLALHLLLMTIIVLNIFYISLQTLH